MSGQALGNRLRIGEREALRVQSPVSTASPIERLQAARLGFALHSASAVAVVASENLKG
jgi:hypothetical protein